jgi:hypothetical protein
MLPGGPLALDIVCCLQRYPNLDADTQPANILRKIEPHCPKGTVLYIATDEKTPGFFDPVAAEYRVFTWESFLDKFAAAGWLKTNLEDCVSHRRLHSARNMRVLGGACCLLLHGLCSHNLLQ